MSAEIPSEIHSELLGLDTQQQSAVLEFLRRLKSAPTGTKGSELLTFAGILSHDEARSMIDCIEQDCGKVDKDEW